MTESSSFVLASSSQARCDMLKSAGLTFTVDPADLNEEAIRSTLLKENETIDPQDIAQVLARAKGEYVSERHPETLVVAADQILSIDGEILTKPTTREAARETLIKLRSKTHALHSAATITKNGETQWAKVDTAYLTMRDFSADFLANYTLRGGTDLLQSVGAYKIEGPGIQLFKKIEGDYFTILGLPLLPLLAELRKLGGANV